MSLLTATVLTGIGTLVLAAGAIVTAVLAGLALRKQAQEVRAIEQQLADQHEQLVEQRAVNARQARLMELHAQELRESLAERRRAQASRVLVWEEYLFPGVKYKEPGMVAHIRNASDYPVYKVTISWQTSPPRLAPMGTLIPSKAVHDGHTGLQLNPACPFAVFFRDAAGTNWRATLDGQCDAIPAESVTELMVPEFVQHLKNIAKDTAENRNRVDE